MDTSKASDTKVNEKDAEGSNIDAKIDKNADPSKAPTAKATSSPAGASKARGAQAEKHGRRGEAKPGQRH
ncbi:unnamed protein product [Adineta steineri]|uniref:Uncharacterized protein n=1 Tax=Adineta steineri TaxID=433720 RepID=A0A819MQA8_9BILA|nr:unnamed protein product [Adineta steineri]